jgi:catechol 2,3-dioxygenase-like lactoylglutathione lyase family enzyme
MELHGVHHVSLNVDDIETTGPFYRDVLGLEQIERPDFGFPGLWFRAQGQEIHLIQVEKHQAPQGQHFAFRVADLDRARAELEERGVKVSKAFEIPGVGRQAFLRDPAGNQIELNQPNG